MFFKKKKNEVEDYSIEHLKKKADEYYAIITKGDRNKVPNFVEARYLVYAVDIMDWATESFHVDFSITENDIPVLESLIGKIREGVQQKFLTEEDALKYLNGIAGIFGLILSRVCSCEWIDENRTENGYRMKGNNSIYFIEARVLRTYYGEDGVDLQSLYIHIKDTETK